MKLKIRPDKKYFWILVGILFGGAIYQAWFYRWLSDDAYISFRYAANLLAGKGLVFNEGIRVEGFSNPLWTFKIAAAMALGFSPEKFTVFAGIFFYALTAVFLIYHALQWQKVPVAFFGYILFLHGWHFATSGLETSSWIFYLTAGTLLVLRQKDIGYLLLSLGVLTRPEGILYYLLVSMYDWYFRRRHERFSIAAFLTTHQSASLFIVYFVFRLFYYQDIFPNTYYAKSAGSVYIGQGLDYYFLFLKTYPLFSAILGGSLLYAFWRGDGRQKFIAILVLIHTAYVIKIGGDFMLARFIVPLVPLNLVLLEEFVPVQMRLVQIILAIAPLVHFNQYSKGEFLVHGIAEERSYYSLDRDRLIYNKTAFKNMKIAFYGAQAHFVYYMDPLLAIEGQTGLTDKYIARRELLSRGVVGHEKIAPLDYLRDEGVNIVMADAYLELGGEHKSIYMDWNGYRLEFKVLWYDRALMENLASHSEFDLSPVTNYIKGNPALRNQSRIDMSRIK